MMNTPKNYTEQLYKHLIHKAKMFEKDYNDHSEFFKQLNEKVTKVRDEIKSKGKE
ncbi:hypothetical protein [Pseudoalteromonas sp. JC28]|uniref:hypothetical protein n=1 Tax=Pseudoalteromonas sp. JC28 TaxID=2267617 RepID=UPI0015717538|nr:hypothetical protein [Pseudoalteromonas sp. JC28]